MLALWSGAVECSRIFLLGIDDAESVLDLFNINFVLSWNSVLFPKFWLFKVCNALLSKKLWTVLTCSENSSSLSGWPSLTKSCITCNFYDEQGYWMPLAILSSELWYLSASVSPVGYSLYKLVHFHPGLPLLLSARQSRCMIAPGWTSTWPTLPTSQELPVTEKRIPGGAESGNTVVDS